MSQNAFPALRAACAASLIACIAPVLHAQDSSSTSTAGRTGTTMTPSTAALGKADQAILVDLARGNLAEIDLAHIAETKSANPQVKSYAQTMITDHTKALKDIQQLAQAKGVTLPTETDAKHKELVKQMEALSAERFDRQYLSRGGVTEHQEMRRKLQQAQRNASDADLKALVARIAPVVEEHMHMAQQATGAKSTAGSTVSSGSSGSSGTSGTTEKTPR